MKHPVCAVGQNSLVLIEEKKLKRKQAQDRAKVADGWAGSEVLQNLSRAVLHTHLPYNDQQQ